MTVRLKQLCNIAAARAAWVLGVAAAACTVLRDLVDAY